MFKVPVTYAWPFSTSVTTENMRSYVMHAFAEAGAKHLVLNSTLISQIFENELLMGRLEREMSGEGLTFVDAHSPFGEKVDLNEPDPMQRRNLILRHKLAIQIAAQMGVNTITIHVGISTAVPGVSVDRQRALTIEALQELLPTAESCGVTICIENIWFPNTLPCELNAIRAAIKSPNLGFCYDSGHANMLNPANSGYEKTETKGDWEKSGISPIVWSDHALEDMLPEVVNCHLHDNDGQWDRHLCVDQGTTDWHHIIPLLKRAPRLKCIQSEVSILSSRKTIKQLCQAFEDLGEIE